MPQGRTSLEYKFNGTTTLKTHCTRAPNIRASSMRLRASKRRMPPLSDLFQSRRVLLTLVLLLSSAGLGVQAKKGRLRLHSALRTVTSLVEADRGASADEHIASLVQVLPPHMLHTIAVVQANVAAINNDWTLWTKNINAFLAHYNTSPICIHDRDTSDLLAQMPDAEDEDEDQEYTEAAGQEAAGFMSHLTVATPVQDVQCGPLISVIMVARNAEPTVVSAVASILDQTWRHLELVIVDDASTDKTWSILNRLKAVDGRIRLLRNRIRVGAYVSRNRALRQAVRGAYITGHDADDWAHPSRLESQVNVLLKSGGQIRANVAYMLRIKPDGRVTTSGTSWFSPDGAARLAMVSAMFERRLLLDELGHWDGVQYGADAEMIARTKALLGDGFAEVPIISMLCRDQATGLGKSGYNAPEPVPPPANGRRTLLARDATDVSTSWAKSNRARYREAFEEWHATARSTGDARLPFIHKERRFYVPDGMAIAVRKVGLLVVSCRKIAGFIDKMRWADPGIDDGCHYDPRKTPLAVSEDDATGANAQALALRSIDALATTSKGKEVVAEATGSLATGRKGLHSKNPKPASPTKREKKGRRGPTKNATAGKKALPDKNKNAVGPSKDDKGAPAKAKKKRRPTENTKSHPTRTKKSRGSYK